MTFLNGAEIIRFCCRSIFLRIPISQTMYLHRKRLYQTYIHYCKSNYYLILFIDSVCVCVCVNVQTVTTKKYFARIFSKIVFLQCIYSLYTERKVHYLHSPPFIMVYIILIQHHKYNHRYY